RRQRARRSARAERRREVHARQDRVRLGAGHDRARGGVWCAGRLAGGPGGARISRGALPLPWLDDRRRVARAASASGRLTWRRARAWRATRARRLAGGAAAACRGNVEGNAAAARDCAGARRLTAAAAARRADECARSGREADRTQAARRAATARRLRPAQLAPPQRDRARLRPRGHPARRTCRERGHTGRAREATGRRDRDRRRQAHVPGGGARRHPSADRRARSRREERVRGASAHLDARGRLRRGRGRRGLVTAIWTIAEYGLRDALGRKVFVVVCFLTIAFLGLYWLGARYAFHHVAGVVPPEGVAGRTFAGGVRFGMARCGTL